jgi:primosomal protein N' (replication factor Y)
VANSKNSLEVCSSPTPIVQVALDVPLAGPFDYDCTLPVQPGQRVLVPFGRQRRIGVVLGFVTSSTIDPAQRRSVLRVFDDLAPLQTDWIELCRFAAAYYHRPLGEVMLPALPPSLRDPKAYENRKGPTAGPVARLRKRRRQPVEPPTAPSHLPKLTPLQQQALDQLLDPEHTAPRLLFGVTGSGKTRLYLEAARDCIARARTVLLLVPEINLTPQLVREVARTLSLSPEAEELVVMHSGLSAGERLAAWMAAAEGRAKMVIGTRLAVFAPLPALGLIVVDEEHDASYKQQEGLRYSARDLAVWRARQQGCPVVLGSATPSLESWQHALEGRYRRIDLPERVSGAVPPPITLVDTRRASLHEGLSETVVRALDEVLSTGRQALVFLNRRGYSPVLHCPACGWLSGCTRCSAWMVMHRPTGSRGQLRCHHCGAEAPIPRACPDCGNPELQALGRGTQRLEESLAQRWPQARVARVDADSTRGKGRAEALFDAVHAGNYDLLVGTQMLAKGHDFDRLALVVVLQADTLLYSQDFRAPERLFAQLMQVAGRAGRRGQAARVLVQTSFPDHALYRALLAQDYPGFAQSQLAERKMAGMPPFGYQALLTAQAPKLAQALDFLAQARAALPLFDGLIAYDPVPLRVVRVNRVERAQLLVESARRAPLHEALRAWQGRLEELSARQPGRVRWHLEIDPLQL